MTLSPRLSTVANLVTQGHKIADIGTDHAYIPIFLVKKKRIPHALAMDIRHGPLEIARENIKRAKLANHIEVRQSDGLKNLKAHEVDSIVVAGMGGNLTIKILSENWQVTRQIKECILQPQSDIEEVRTFLVDKGFTFIKEEMVEDAGKYYPMMKVTPPHTSKTNSDKAMVCERWSELELKFGKLLLKRKNPTLKRFLSKELTIKEKILEKLEQEDGKHIKKRKKEILEEMELIKAGLFHF